MNTLKRVLGIIWMILGAAFAGYFPYKTVLVLSSPSATSEDFVFWIVVTLIFIPVMLGLVLFGYYAVKGEYNNLEETDEEAAAALLKRIKTENATV